MATVYVPTLFRNLCGGAHKLEIPAATLGELLKAVELRCPGFYERVVEDGRVRPELAIAIDGEAAGFPLWEPLSASAEVSIIPAVGGGSRQLRTVAVAFNRHLFRSAL